MMKPEFATKVIRTPSKLARGSGLLSTAGGGGRFGHTGGESADEGKREGKGEEAGKGHGISSIPMGDYQCIDKPRPRFVTLSTAVLAF